MTKIEYFKSPARNTRNKFEMSLPVVSEKYLEIRGGENAVDDIINIKYYISFFRKIYNNFFSLISKKYNFIVKYKPISTYIFNYRLFN